MGKVKWILVCGVLVAALSVNVAAAGPKSDTNVFFSSHVTPAFSVVLANLMMSQAGGEELETALSVSNTLGIPPIASPADASPGLPEDGVVTEGPVWLFCFNQDGTNWAFNSSTDLVDGAPIGTGLNSDGLLEAGGTWTVFLSEVINAVAGEDLSFVGYCYVVGQDFGAIAGTYVNFLPLVGIQQDFAMQSDFTGVPIFAPETM